MSFWQFLKQVRFSYIAGTSFLIFLFIVGLFEVIRYAFDESSDPALMQYLHLTRGAVTVFVLLGWIAWTLFEFRDRFTLEMRQHDDQYRRILDSTRDAIVIIDPANRIRFMNPAAAALQEELGENWLPTHRLQRPVVESELEWIPAGAQRRILNATVTTLTDTQGMIESRALVIRDITGQAVRLAQMERSERMASLGHMAAGVAHEIGNPLTAISSIVQLLQRRIVEQDQQEMLGQLRDNIQRITRIVRDLVDFSRPKPVEVKDVFVKAIADDVIGLLRHDARCRNVTFETDLPSDLPAIRAVPDKLYQVLLNLILNAVDATIHLDKPVISIHCRQEGTSLAIEIRDNGKGVPPELQGRIFEPFFTTKEVGKGTGLGLSVSYNLVEQMGGRLTLISEPGSTTFRILVPLPG